ncbi:KAP family P-loop NTPase fold protein [Halpernia frigidisoli]|uniref:KAP family P-loop domain-containing protein n=1 Tax=Halpernia frigidisoli TaxID=1125876 RepID=A0A1I3FSV2_9FLAO|nr:P-loop NTPase fold protein [Halpernia frigidisoli]SFI14300.1 KAP family P-loop domain-containing protein [Halpernia frigidisoli]
MKFEKVSGKILYFLLGIFLVFFCNPIFIFLFTKYINEYSSQFESNVYFIFIFIIICFLITSITVKKCSKSIPDKKNTYFLLLIVFYYSYHRYCGDVIEFLPYESKIKYLDVIYLIFALDLGKYLKILSPSKTFPISKLYGDSALKNIEDNELGDGIDKFVEKINTIIRENCFSTAYSIGINSQWGDGKTSSLNILKNKLNVSENSDDYVLIDFNPWLSFDNKILVGDFFKSITENLSNDILSKQITEYASKLIDEDKSLSKFIKSFVPFLDDHKSLETIFDKINNSLTILNKKLIIFIDDVDRLDNEEVFQLLKLIRNTANFRNTFFVIAYDRDYINNAIVKVNSFPSNNYLNKIINIELSLPYYDKNILSNIFIKKVLNLIGENYREQITKAISSFDKMDLFLDGLDQKNSFGYWITNIRDIKKLADSIYINFDGLLEDVDFEDLLIVEILHLKYPNVYKLIFNKKDDLFYENNGILYIKPKITSHENRTNEINDFSKTFFNFYLTDLIRKGSLLREDKGKVVELFRKLFSLKDNSGIGFTNFREKKENYLTVNRARKFERYFAQIISRENLSEIEWNQLINSNDKEEMFLLISKYVEEGKEEDLIERLENFQNFVNYEQFINFIYIIFQISKTPSTNFSGKINISTKQLLNLFSFPNDSTKQILELNNSQIKDVFLDELESSNNLFNLDFLISLYEKGPYKNVLEFENKILSREEVHIILKNYFFKFLDDHGIKSDEFWNYYHGAKTIEYIEHEAGSNIKRLEEKIYLDDDVKEKLIFIGRKDNNINSFLRLFIETNNRNENSLHIRRSFIDTVFDNVDNFKLFLEDLDQIRNPFLEEFKSFFRKCERDDFKNFINFNFTTL